MITHRLSRRDFLRATAAGAVGLAGAQLIGCGDGDGTPSPTATAGVTPSAATATPGAGALGWRQLAPAGTLPPARRDHSLVTDGERLYLFGGRSGGDAVGDTWVYDLAANEWEELNAPGPGARFGHNSVWSTRGRMVVFGGQAGGEFLNDTWLFDPADGMWQEIPDFRGAPSQRYGAAAALDPSGRLVVTHGFTNQGRFDDTWGFALLDNFWTEISPDGARPIERCLVRAVWDAARERLIMFGGQTTATPFLGDTWALTGSEGWLELTPQQSPSPRNFYAMAFDEVAGRALLIGGQTEDGPANDLWAFDAASDSWARLTLDGESPSARAGHDAAFAAGSLYVVGGYDGSSELNDLWVLSAT